VSTIVEWGILHWFVSNRCNISSHNFKNVTVFLFISVTFYLTLVIVCVFLLV